MVVCGFVMPCSSGFLPVLSAVDEYGIISDEVPVAQWIERRSPEPWSQVRFLSGTLLKNNKPRYYLGLLFLSLNSFLKNLSLL